MEKERVNRKISRRLNLDYVFTLYLFYLRLLTCLYCLKNCKQLSIFNDEYSLESGIILHRRLRHPHFPRQPKEQKAVNKLLK
jgi:hypothetical protein